MARAESEEGIVSRSADAAVDLPPLVRLAELDALLREREAARMRMVHGLVDARSGIEVLATRIQGERRELAGFERRAGDGTDDTMVRQRRQSLRADEARYAQQLVDFEMELRRAEPLRSGLQEETNRLQEERVTVLNVLPRRIRSVYESLVKEGRVPAIASAAGGVCSGCRSRLPAPLADEIFAGESLSCPGCGRLLCHPRETG